MTLNIVRGTQEPIKISERRRTGFVYIKCSYCLRPIQAGREFSERIKIDRGIYYHKACYNSAPKCPVCLKAINCHMDEESFQHSIWPQIKYCKIHIDKIPKCSICEKYQPKGEKYIKLVDERILCNDCRWTAIMDMEKLQSLKNYLLHFFKVRHVSFKNELPIYLVDMNEIKRLANRGAPLLSDCTVSRVTRHRHDIFISSITSCTLREENIMMEIVPERRQELQLKPPWILIAYGLPWLLAGELLAQEIMHVWLQLRKDYKMFNWHLKEGICKAVAYHCLDYISDPAGGDKLEKRIKFFRELRDFRKTKIQNEQPEAFGPGYIAVINAIKRYGLPSALDRIFVKTDGGRSHATMITEDDFAYSETN